MSTVTQRSREVKQPWGGYIRPSHFEKIDFYDGEVLNDKENVAGCIVGMVIDYLTRFIMGSDVEDAFSISMKGAYTAEHIGRQKGALRKARKLLANIKEIDEKSIINACKLVTYDVWYRDLFAATLAKGADETNPDTNTVHNIIVMVERSIKFWESYGPIMKDNYTFEPYGYTKTVNAGDGDFLTTDTLWEFKVLRTRLTSKHTLQLLMYWIMGQHSGQDIFKSIHKLGVFNPRLNRTYLFDMKNVSKEIIREIERDVICY